MENEKEIYMRRQIEKKKQRKQENCPGIFAQKSERRRRKGWTTENKKNKQWPLLVCSICLILSIIDLIFIDHVINKSLLILPGILDLDNSVLHSDFLISMNFFIHVLGYVVCFACNR